MSSTLHAGIDSLSQRQRIVFRRYTRLAIASDSSVFWVNSGEEMIAQGSLHYATDREMDETETKGQNEMVFSSESEITRFNAISPSSMWIGSWPVPGSPPLRVAFSSRSNLYREAEIWHYVGHAIYPVLLTQIIDDPADIPAGPIVSNSLPIWLAQTSYNGNSVQVFPSFLAEENFVPPYVVAHVAPEMTESLSAAPAIGPWPGTIEPNSGASPLHDLAASQLCRDEVTLTLYGFDNQAAWQYLISLYEASRDGTAPFGFANSPVISDAKHKQTELSTLAQKKTIVISANYLQGTADAIARRLILSAMVSDVEIIGGVLPVCVGAVTQSAQTVSGEGNVFE